MSGLSRYVSILRLFAEDKPDWTVAEIGMALDVPVSTAYRTVRELAAQGFVEPSIEAHYRLGHAFLEFDRMIQLTDPLVRAGGRRLLRELVREARLPCVAVLARLYGSQVICSADELAENAEIPTSYELGRPMPMTRGATSKAVLSLLPVRRVRQLLEGTDWGEAAEGRAEDFMASLAAVRRGGFCITHGEVDTGLAGVAVPIANPELAISASLSLVLREESLDPSVEQRLVLLLVASANLISRRLEDDVATA